MTVSSRNHASTLVLRGRSCAILNGNSTDPERAHELGL